MIYAFGKYIFMISCYIAKNKKIIATVYSLYDLTKFTFQVSNNLGIIQYINNYINKKEKKILFLEYTNIKCGLETKSGSNSENENCNDNNGDYLNINII